MIHKISILLLLLNSCSNVLSDVLKTIKFEKCQECPSEHLIDFSNISLYSKDRFIMGKGSFVVKKDLHPTFYAKISASRCKENTRHACETFLNNTVMDFCERLKNPKMQTHRYLAKIRPSFRCPIKANSYSLDAVDIFMGSLLDLPVEGYRWIGKFTGIGKPLGEKKGMMTVGCYVINVRVMSSTTRKRVIKSQDVVLT